VIRRVFEGDAYSTLALSRELERSGLTPRDRALAAELAYGTIRTRLRLDPVLAAASSRPLDRIDPEAMAILRLGAYQLGYTRVPAHAAVKETVALARPRHRGFVNAVLRAVSAAAEGDAPGSSPDPSDAEAVSAATGLVPWAAAELARVLPADEVVPAARALAAPAPLSLRVNTCAASRERVVEALRGAGVEATPAPHHPDVLRAASAQPARLPGFAEGWFTVQDQASALVVAALGLVAGDRALDACAGPGGKATHIACLVGTTGCAVATDVNARRAGLVRAAARRLGVPVRVAVADARTPPLSPASFDAVLVDAPCSGLGAARRRPELLWRPSKDRLGGLARLQVAILAAASDLVRPGGRLVYSVCTFPRAETDAAVRAFRAKRPGFEPMTCPGPDGPAATHRLWPHRHGTDAMFFAAFRRPGEGGD
jgi:16S rRNA (cytosine967-C5)-methyltransferase